MNDPWVILPKERAKYQEQFTALHPNDGIITGAQARGFFLQSQLPAIVLGEIWSLADTDSDGKMNINEFSIACKLINLKIRGFNVPASVPPSLLASLPSVANTPTNNAQLNLSSDLTGGLMSANTMMMPQMTSYNNAGQLQQNNMSGILSQPIAPMMGGIESMMQHQQQQQPPLIEPMAGIGMTTTTISPQKDQLLNNIVSGYNSASAVTSKLPSPPTPPNNHSPMNNNRNQLIGERAPSIETSNAQTMGGSGGGGGGGGGGPIIEWAIKGPIKLKYTQLFNTTDRTRSGYLTGVQARHLMVQTKLPQSTLAQIWSLADMDLDGRLGCEEFVLAMYLCDVAVQGETIPTKLPYDLIPPSFRKALSRHGSVVSSGGGGGVHGAVGIIGGGGGSGSINTSRQGSITSIQGVGGTLIDADPSAGLPGQTSFEDKRKENFDKGQAELERRRKVLLDIQRKEQEERERKEREEADKREKARLDIERRQREELERQLQLQKEIEMEKEEKRKREIEQKEMARKEMEKQRQLEWEKQRITEMQLQRQREQEKVLKLKAQNQAYNIELSTLTEKVKDLSQKICDTRSGVTNVKSVIDGMRSTRDIQMNDMAQLKTRIKEQNQKLVQLSQEKLKLENKNKGGGTTTGGGNSQEQLNAAFTNKQIIINQLRDKLKTTKEDVNCKSTEYSINTEQLTELKENLKNILIKCEEIYGDYDGRRTQVLELKNNKKIELSHQQITTTTWDDASTNRWPETSSSSSPPPLDTNNQQNINTAGDYTKYRAIYEFSARNSDEITFQTGDIIRVPLIQTGEPGWLSGEINGHTGWFPSTYVELISNEDHLILTGDNTNTYTDNRQSIAVEAAAIIPEPKEEEPLQEIPTPNSNSNDNISEYYIAAYPYQSNETGDLIFEVGEYITVIKKDGEWWTGTIGSSRCGIFPSNYVEPVSSNTNDYGVNETATITAATANNGNQQEQQQQQSSSKVDASVILLDKMAKTSIAEINTIEEAAKEDTADTEVSEINTHTNNQNNHQEQNMESYSRPMSTSSNTTGFKKNRDVAQVIAPYEATSSEQLSLQRGQLINIRKKTDSGWWEGELQARGKRKQIGWFPATYVKVLHSGRTSGRNTPVSGGKIQMNETILDKVIALFPYKAQNHDELSFEKDDIISVLGRDEPEWWRGECQGLTGLFPSNYVGPFMTSGNN